MITSPYSEFLAEGAEAAGRTRDKVPPSEQVMLRSYIASDIRKIWQGQNWPELILVGPQVAVLNHGFSKNEGLATEMGDFYGYYERAPRSLEEEPWFDFDEGNGVVNIRSRRALVYPVYQLPCPDINTIAVGQLLAYALPRRFLEYVANRAGGKLLRADGDFNGMGACFGLAKDAMMTEQARAWDSLPSWLKRARFQQEHCREFCNHDSGLNGQEVGQQVFAGDYGGNMPAFVPVVQVAIATEAGAVGTGRVWNWYGGLWH